MAAHGFQSNTTITTSFWWYKSGTSYEQEIFIDVNSILWIEASADHSKVWIYFAANTGSTNAQPYIITGDIAEAFMTDMEGLFS